MADVIVATKDALTTAQEKLLFEELVKYKELGSTFSLYVVKSSLIEVDTATSNTVSSQSNENVQFSLPIPAQIVNQRISVLDNSETEKLTVSLVPLGKDLYNKVKSLFDRTPGKEQLYGLIYFKENGQPIEADGSPIEIPEAQKKCNETTYCFEVKGMQNKIGKIVFAYLMNGAELRKLIDEIREIDDPSPSGRSSQ